MALLKGLDFLERLGCSNVVIESDSLELIQACNGTIEIWNPYSAIQAECFLKASNILTVSFQHCYREANQVTHQLAKFAYESKKTYFGMVLPQGLFCLSFYMM